MFALVTEVGSGVDAFERFSVDEMLEVEYLSVAQQFEGQGLGSRLVEVSNILCGSLRVTHDTLRSC